MVWAFIGIVINVRNEDNPPSCLVRGERGGEGWYRVSARVAPALRVGEWVAVTGGGDPDEPDVPYPEPQIVGRAEQPAPPDALSLAGRAAAAELRSEILPHIPKYLGPPPGTVQLQHVAAGIQISIVDRSGKRWSIVRLDAGGWASGYGDAPRTVTEEAFAALDALVTVYREAITHL